MELPLSPRMPEGDQRSSRTSAISSRTYTLPHQLADVEINAQPRSRMSWAPGGRSRTSAASFSKWDVASSKGFSDSTDDDFDEVLMYYTDEEMSETTNSFDFNGFGSEASWEPQKDGLWALRPASGLLPCYLRR